MEYFVPFLKTVANDLVEKNGDSRDFSKLTVVFPNKRARLFMNKHLLEVYKEKYGESVPLWAPNYATSSNLLEYFAKLYGIRNKVVPDVDKVQLILLLYSVYQDVSHKRLLELDENSDNEIPKKVLNKSFDEFYFLGEIILNDFDDIDKHLVDARQIFSNFKEMMDIKNFDYLTEEQVKAVQDFLDRHFSTDTALYKGFITLWEVLGDIYVEFKQILEEKNLAYAGMLHRKVADCLKIGLPEQLPDNLRFAFVGFNALNGCEKMLLKKMGNRLMPDGRPAALFYWDYDLSYFNPSAMSGPQMKRRCSYRDDAGTFMRIDLGGFSAIGHTSNNENMFLSLPNELKSEPNGIDSSRPPHDYLSRLAGGNHMKVLSASTDTAQTKYVAKYLAELKAKNVADDDIAIVLCDENLLPAVLHSIPSSVKCVNVTMGFPITQTPGYVLAIQLFQLQMGHGRGNRFLYENVVSIIRNDIIRKKLGGMASSILKTLKANARSYISKDEILAIAKDYVEKETLINEGSNLKPEEKEWRNKHNLDALSFVGTLFAVQNVSPETPAEGLINWLLDVMGMASTIYKEAAYKSKDIDRDNLDDADHNFVGLYEEAYYQVCRILNCLSTTQQNCSNANETLFIPLFGKLLSKMFASAKVPYSGEPARGVQIMGFLETRSLDFKHILMLSVDEKHMPKDSFAPSFIPYALRVAYNLPAIEHEDALYAYNFFRLLQRPASMTMVYNASSTNSSGEPSRFLRQLKNEYRAFTNVIHLAFDNKQSDSDVVLEVQKTSADIDYLKDRYLYMPTEERTEYNKAVRATGGVQRIDLSPSALNCYLDCSLRFYFRYIKHLTIDEDMDMDVDEAFFGRIFHKSMELIYCTIAQKKPDAKENWKCLVSTDALEPFAKTERLQQIVDEAFSIEFHINKPDDYTGIQLIKRDVLVELVRKQVNEDLRYAENGGFIIYEPEFTIAQPVEVEIDGQTKFSFRIGGVVDRRDLKNSVFRVVDYKTGGDALGSKRKAKDVSAMFKGGSNRSDKVFQTTLYSCLWNMKTGVGYNRENQMVQPVLMFPREMNDKYKPELILGIKNDAQTIAINTAGNPEYADVEDVFMGLLKNTLKQMLDVNVPFKATDDEKSCGFCQFKAICHRDKMLKK